MKLSIDDLRARVSYDLTPRALERWNPSIHAAAEADNSISIMDVIGQDYWTGEGVTAKRIGGILRTMKGKDVTININSPGGDMFEGIAIYNVLKEYEGQVTVKVLSLAASAASLIAMAGDTIQVAKAGFLMIHNAWVVAMGNRNDMMEIATTLEPFDRAMAGIYADRSGITEKDALKMMDQETWITGQDAVDQGFADSLLDTDSVKSESGSKNASYAARKFDLALAKAGMPRNERKTLLDEIRASARDTTGSGTPEATGLDALGAVDLSKTAALAASINIFKGINHASN